MGFRFAKSLFCLGLNEMYRYTDEYRFHKPTTPIGNGIGWSSKHKLYAMNCMKFSDLHKKVMLDNQHTQGVGQIPRKENSFSKELKMSRSAQKIIFNNAPSRGGRGWQWIYKIIIFTWNLMKCLNLHRNVMFTISPPPCQRGDRAGWI